ncbi:hypothetical protein BCR34DRAFT_649725 [Clohesyomyces aquaticus]|uniref:Uncharacterized protein n=1 Tax=Clohesyomyces aquaticus TaxID=1231657 RepID=A0A1Y1ZSI2_9PLEO|nr:hypothetical protein BCR34DRAFT_649725 [Clohesyomyces aquaticus]
MTTQPARPGPSRTMESALPIPRSDTAEDSSGSAGELVILESDPCSSGGPSAGRLGDKAADSDIRAEGRVRRKFQRTASNTAQGLRQSSAMSATAAPPRAPLADNKSSFRGRRQSVREHKAPLGPRPLDLSKRVVSGASVASSSETTAASRSFLPTSTGEPPVPQQYASAQQPTRASNPRYSFGKHAASSSKDLSEPSISYDFLPSVTFDDFHASISSYEPALSDFPAPGGGGGILASSTASQRTNMGPETFTAASDTRPARSASLMRRFSNARTQSDAVTARKASEQNSMPPPPTNMSIRTRRQSQFPAPTPSNPAARPPRKSVGPGVLPSSSSSDIREGRPDIPKLTNDNTLGRVGRTPSFTGGSRRGTLSNTTLNATAEPPRMANSARTAKAKSLQPPPRQPPANINASTASTMTPEHIASLNINHARSPGRSPGNERKRRLPRPANASQPCITWED